MISSSYWKCKENKVVLAISLVIYVVALFNTAYYPEPMSYADIPPDSDWTLFVIEGIPCWREFFFDIIFFPIPFWGQYIKQYHYILNIINEG